MIPQSIALTITTRGHPPIPLVWKYMIIRMVKNHGNKLDFSNKEMTEVAYYTVSKVGDRSRERHEGFFFNSYYTEQ